MEAILEACHIKPYSDLKDYSISNGLLLRSDIHTLFDLNLIKLHPDDTRICVDQSITDPTYRNLHGKSLRRPRKMDEQPNKEFLMIRWKQPT
jgi:predicted restriction endonuclease